MKTTDRYISPDCGVYEFDACANMLEQISEGDEKPWGAEDGFNAAVLPGGFLDF